jgi:hypothetical protein
VNHEIYRGDTVNFRLQVKDYLERPADITGWVFVLTAVKTKGGMVAFNTNGVIEDALSGRVLFELTPEQTAIVGKYFYDIEATTNQSKIHTIDSGEIEIIQDVTLPSVGDVAFDFPDFIIIAYEDGAQPDVVFPYFILTAAV